MEIEDSPVYKEIKEIIDDGPKPVSYYYKAIIHADGNDYEVVKTMDVIIDADYATKISEFVVVRVMVPFGLWAKKIYPFRTDLELTLKRIPLEEASDTEEEKEDIETQRFFAVPNPETMPSIDGQDIENLTMEELDNYDMLYLEFQLTDKTVHQLRLKTVGGIYRRTTLEDVCKYVLQEETKKIKGDDESGFKGVDFYKADNKDPREHIVIPAATKIVDLPVYLHRRCGGIYSSGIGTFYSRQHWFIYPLFDTTRSSAKTLSLIKVPVHRHTGLERTYREEGDTIYIIGTSDSEIRDDAMTNFTDSGNGVRFADSRKQIRDFVKTSGNKAIANRKEMNHEFVIFDRGSQKNAVFESVKFAHSNPYVERSDLASKLGGIFRMNWENSQPSLLFPGMMCKIHYLSNNKVKEIQGVLLGYEAAVLLTDKGITSTRHITSTVLTIFINPPKDEEPPAEDPDAKPISDWTKYEAL